MEINSNYLIAHQYFDHKGRHLSVFGRFNQVSNKLYIWTLTCSKKDNWSKKGSVAIFKEYLTAREEDEQPTCKPTLIAIQSSFKTYKRDFIKYCRETYWQKVIDFISPEYCKEGILMEYYINGKNTRLNHNSVRVIKTPWFVTEIIAEQQKGQEVLDNFIIEQAKIQEN